ncbi:MAG: hypothetical protein IBJ18_04315 [Phycisphaerales bacterium]|nr:hypothetical protein [Phycisphaerales bacterium]
MHHRTRSTITACLPLVAVALSAPVASADIVWWQWGYNSNAGSSISKTETRTQSTFDDFTTPAGNSMPWQISRFRVAILSNLPSAPPQSRVNIFSNNADAPGSLVHSGAVTNILSWGQAGNGMQISELWFDMNLTLQANTKYWVSISTPTNITGQALWAPTTYTLMPSNSAALYGDSAYNNGALSTATMGTPSLASTGVNMSLTVFGTQAAVPTPAAMTTGLAAMTYLASRRRRVTR